MIPDTVWLLENWQRMVDTVCMAVVVVACIIHYTENLGRHSPSCEVVGFILTGAGCLGEAIYHWTTRVEPFNFGLLLHIGIAFIAVSLIQGRVRALLARTPGLGWTDRRNRT